MEQTKYPLWKKRNELRRPSALTVVIMIALTVVLSAITAAGFGGMLCMGLAGCTFAILLTAVRGILPWITLPLSFGVAFLLTGDILLSVFVLLYVPVGIVLAYCAFTERGLSVTVVALTVALLVSMSALLTVSVTEMYSQAIAESYKSLGAELEKSFFDMFSKLSYSAPDGEVYTVPEETVKSLIEMSVMILPAVIVVTCQLLAYVTARIFKALESAYGTRVLFFGKEYGVTLSIPCAIIYLVSVAVSFFAMEASVIAYSAINLVYILMPASAIVGFKLLFYKNGFLRRNREGRRNGLMLTMVIFLAVMSPIAFVQLLCSVACLYTVVKAFFAFKNRNNKAE